VFAFVSSCVLIRPAQNVPHSKTNDHARPPLSQANGHALGHKSSRSDVASKRADSFSQPSSSGHLAPARVNALARKGSSISDTPSAPDSLLDLYGENRSAMNSVDYGDRALGGKDVYDAEDPEHSRWIHRDKLARIESQELQAAGIILPRTRATSKSSRRDHSRDAQANGHRSEQSGQKRQRIEEDVSLDEESSAPETWDLRLPAEIAADPSEGYRDMSGGVKGVSRIPVLKTSPLPIPMEHLERDKVLRRRHSNPLMSDEEPITNAKTRGRSQSIKILEDATSTPTPASRVVLANSPTKKTPAPRKVTGGASVPPRPKTKPPGRDTNSGQRPSTRSGELGTTSSVTKRPDSITKRPEGDPPWLATMYKPDPRLPPDQQLLPTVAKRLQQEQWEREGKFGNIYDTSFRPLNDEQLPEKHVPSQIMLEPYPKTPEQSSAEWPLMAPKSPALSTGRPGTAGRTESYSVMPKVAPSPRLGTTPHMGKPQGVGPLPSPKPPVQAQEAPEPKQKEGGCGCCVIM
jgi:hypothetical protein